MNVTLKRDGLTLSGELLKPDVEKCPILIIFHGFKAKLRNFVNQPNQG